MSKIVLLAAASVIALCAACAVSTAAPKFTTYSGKYGPSERTHILYSQNSNDAGSAINSQNYTSGNTQYNNQGADDFVIPKGQSWRITEVDVTGLYFNGTGPATSVNVLFYKNMNGKPGNAVTNGTFTNLNGTSGPNFALVLPGKGLKLKAGRYWVSVIENADEFYQGEWGWEVSTLRHGKQAMWQNPGGGFSNCTTWGTIENCVGSPGPDLMFALRGNVL